MGRNRIKYGSIYIRRGRQGGVGVFERLVKQIRAQNRLFKILQQFLFFSTCGWAVACLVCFGVGLTDGLGMIYKDLAGFHVDYRSFLVVLALLCTTITLRPHARHRK